MVNDGGGGKVSLSLLLYRWNGIVLFTLIVFFSYCYLFLFEKRGETFWVVGFVCIIVRVVWLVGWV